MPDKLRFPERVEHLCECICDAFLTCGQEELIKGDIDAELHAVEQETLEKACRAICGYCSDTDVPAATHDEQHDKWIHAPQTVIRRGQVGRTGRPAYCRAAPIRKLMEKPDA